MKKIVAISAFLMSISLIASAQESIRFGFQLSPAFSWMASNSSRINTSGTNLGIKLGMVGEYYFAENYAFTSGIGFHFNSGGTLLYDFPGSYWKKTDLPDPLKSLSADTKLKYDIQYLEIPVGLKMRTREFGYIRYFMEPNLVFGFRTQARGTIKDPGKTGEDEEKYNIRKEVNLLNLSWGINAGIEYTVSENTSLIGGIGFQVGFTDATDDSGTEFYPLPTDDRREDSKGTVGAIVLRLGVMF
ncbi:MAG: hypothetical protein DHS20C18_11830 [Saprospiraceae bacterium]|nr:MAG: hypothetical protein DHS20C18_11830 [Saprospiraceae bacterium]